MPDEEMDDDLYNYVIYSDKLSSNFNEWTVFRFKLPGEHYIYNEYRIGYTSFHASGNAPGNPFIGIISRRPGDFYLGLFELDLNPQAGYSIKLKDRIKENSSYVN